MSRVSTMMNAAPLRIVLLLGTARKERASEAVAKAVAARLSGESGVSLEFIDVAERLSLRTIPSWEDDPAASFWRTAVAGADALVLVVPEYNRSFPGELKILLDSAYDEYARKPVAIVGVSSGRYGAASVVEQLKPTLIEIGLVPIRGSVRVPDAETAVGSDGLLADERVRKALDRHIGEFLWYGRALREARTATT